MSSLSRVQIPEVSFFFDFLPQAEAGEVTDKPKYHSQ